MHWTNSRGAKRGAKHWGVGKREGGGNTCFLFFGGVGGGDVDEYVSFLNDITLLFFIITIIIVDLFVQWFVDVFFL